MVTVTFCCFRFGWTTKKKKIISLYLLIYCCFSVVFCSECDVVIVCTKKDKNKFPNHDKRYQSSLIFLISSLLSFAYWTKSQKFNKMHTKVLHRCCLIKKNIFLPCFYKRNWIYILWPFNIKVFVINARSSQKMWVKFVSKITSSPFNLAYANTS